MRTSFQVGAVVFILAILCTVFWGKEYPPEDMEAFKAERTPAQSELMTPVTPNTTGTTGCHINLEKLIKEDDFNQNLLGLVKTSGRMS